MESHVIISKSSNTSSRQIENKNHKYGGWTHFKYSSVDNFELHLPEIFKICSYSHFIYILFVSTPHMTILYLLWFKCVWFFPHTILLYHSSIYLLNYILDSFYILLRWDSMLQCAHIQDTFQVCPIWFILILSVFIKWIHFNVEFHQCSKCVHDVSTSHIVFAFCHCVP
jgi:hypothetical protein